MNMKPTRFQKAKTVLAETLWPTRCALCDELGVVLCQRCRAALPYIDYWLACPSCGSPAGLLQCCQCNAQSLSSLGLTHLPLDQMMSVVELTGASHRLVTVYKDQGERRLAPILAQCMAAYLPNRWLQPAPKIVAIPASPKALLRRGFDHAALLAQTLAHIVDCEHICVLRRPNTTDQRKLSREERFTNMAGAFAVEGRVGNLSAVILVDDVCTTGATLFAAASCLKAAGVERVYGITFARS